MIFTKLHPKRVKKCQLRADIIIRHSVYSFILHEWTPVKAIMIKSKPLYINVDVAGQSDLPHLVNTEPRD